METDKLIDFNGWANTRILEQLKSLPQEKFVQELGGSFPSIRLTLVHMLEADWIWMNRWKGIPLADVPKDWVTERAAAIQAIWSPMQVEMQALGRIFAATPDKEIKFTTRKGASMSLPFVDIVIHMINHGTYHRGQVVNMMRMLGEVPANTDYFIYCAANRN